MSRLSGSRQSLFLNSEKSSGGSLRLSFMLARLSQFQVETPLAERQLLWLLDKYN